MPTTPFQMKEDLFIFEDAVTSHNLTSEVFKNLFSLNNSSASEDWCEKPLFTQIFKTAGYYVSFISNQYILEDFSDFSAGAFINNSEISNLQFNQRNAVQYSYDMELLNDYYRINPNNRINTLTIFHLIGQHNDYDDRYPKQYQELTRNNYHRKDLTINELSVVTAYDNATRYNDDVIRFIINYYADTNTIILYLSDHGEECYDEIKSFGRSHNNHINKIIAKNEFEIPFWIWCSEKYKVSHPEIVKEINAARKKPFYSSDLGHIMLYLAGINCPYYLEENNILSRHYNKKKKRLLRGCVYYEDLE
jgi:heptose-I-phosphate ethanolaminephosphotransferase